MKINKKYLKLAAVLLFLVIIIALMIWQNELNSSSPSPTVNTQPKTTTNNKQAAPVTFDKTQYSLDDPASVWIVANKKRPLTPKTYTPNDLTVPNMPLRSATSSEEMHVRKATALALETLVAAAKESGNKIMLASGYRSYNTQFSVYNSEVKNYGQTVADTESARPGFSEHQTGWAADLEDSEKTCEVTDCFAHTPQGYWLAANAYKYGFIIRYPEGKQDITGYRYEPWHVRYVGTALATEMHEKKISTLEEFFGLPAAPAY